MAYEQKPGTAAVFTNRNKQNDKQPDYKGNINVLGADLEIAIWDRIDKNGRPYRFVSINEPYSQRTAQQRPSAEMSAINNDDTRWDQRPAPSTEVPPDDDDVRF